MRNWMITSLSNEKIEASVLGESSCIQGASRWFYDDLHIIIALQYYTHK